jgi:hypothetical protein
MSDWQFFHMTVLMYVKLVADASELLAEKFYIRFYIRFSEYQSVVASMHCHILRFAEAGPKQVLNEILM